MAEHIILDMDDLREVAAYAARCAADVLDIFEQSYPSDSRPRDAIDTALEFAQGGKRVKALRDAALAALKAANESENEAASQAARAAMCASSAAFLHPLANSTQVKHILGAAAHAARAAELAASPGDSNRIDHAVQCATPRQVEVLCRYPLAPSSGGRARELLRSLDRALRGTIS